MEVDDPDEEGKCRHLVRGLTWAEYHQDSASPTIEELEAAGLRWRILVGLLSRIVLSRHVHAGRRQDTI